MDSPWKIYELFLKIIFPLRHVTACNIWIADEMEMTPLQVHYS